MELKKRYGRLTVVGERIREGNNYSVPVRCDCGTETYVYFHNLESGATQSCGCLRREQRAENAKRRDEERAREKIKRAETKRRMKELKLDAIQIARKSETLDKIISPMFNEARNMAERIKNDAWREVQHNCGPWEDRLQRREISVAEHNRHVGPILDDNKAFNENVNWEESRLTKILANITENAGQRGIQAMVRTRQLSNDLYSRVYARSVLIALRKLDTDRGGEIAQRLFAHVPGTKEPLRCWIRENRRERKSVGIVLPAAVPLDSPVATN